MTTCGHLEFIGCPPTIDFLLRNFPSITPNKAIDRSMPRCKLCDLIAAQQREDKAVSNAYTRPIRDAKEHIKTAEDLVRRGFRDEELLALLPEMRKTLSKAIKIQGEAIAQAWEEHWTIWGRDEGPELPNVVGVGEDQDEDGMSESDIRGSAPPRKS